MASWQSIPTELKLSIISELDLADVHVLSKVDRGTYQACIPARFRTVRLKHFAAVQQFLENVPRAYISNIKTLDIATHDAEVPCCSNITVRERTDAVIAILAACPGLTSLSLRVAGSLEKSIISIFPLLYHLKQLSISNVAEEAVAPLSERLVVAISASCVSLEDLSLDRITRSALHAPELRGVWPYIPVVLGDEDIPDHPIFGADLRLPSLLRIPTLRKLTIRDTHLGDEHWSTTPVACRLEVLDLGSCYHENEDFNRSCTERIMAAVGPTVGEFSLTTAVSNDTLFAKSSETPLPKLRKLHITPFFPVDSVVETISNLAGSPIESLSMQCYEDDVVDVCGALEEFLTVKLERGSEFYHNLKRIDISVAEAGYTATQEEVEERKKAARKLQDFCKELRLLSVVENYGFEQRPVATARRASMSFAVDVGAGEGKAASGPSGTRPASKARSMTIS